ERALRARRFASGPCGVCARKERASAAAPSRAEKPREADLERLAARGQLRVCEGQALVALAGMERSTQPMSPRRRHPRTKSQVRARPKTASTTATADVTAPAAESALFTAFLHPSKLSPELNGSGPPL